MIFQWLAIIFTFTNELTPTVNLSTGQSFIVLSIALWLASLGFWLYTKRETNGGYGFSSDIGEFFEWEAFALWTVLVFSAIFIVGVYW